MRKQDIKKLTANRRVLVNHLCNLEDVLDYLIQKQVFKVSVREEINVSI
jgi:hypothetical protein